MRNKQEDATRQFKELQEKLGEEWASKQKGIPFLEAFPMEKLWHLCIDNRLYSGWCRGGRKAACVLISKLAPSEPE